jgi:hypothetical protein
MKGKNRVVRTLVGGMITYSQAQLPVPLHGAKNAELPGRVIQGHGDNMSPDGNGGALYSGAHETKSSGGRKERRTMADDASAMV